MKTLKLVLLVFGLGLFGINFSTAQTADEVISKYITTIGGAEKLKALKGVKAEMVTNSGGMEIPVELVQLVGGKMYLKINIQGKSITQMASDGDVMWSTNFMTMKAEKSDAETTANAKLSNADFPDPFLDYKSKGYSIEYAGKETKEGTECHKIKLTKKPITVDGVKTDDLSYHYFDTENNILIQSESEIKTGPAKGQKSTVTFSDYQEIEGIYFPFSINQGGQVLKVKKMSLNPVVDNKDFALPVQ